ncbi:MAG: SBBP repeat-containing protein [Promethearchaeota archaeon]
MKNKRCTILTLFILSFLVFNLAFLNFNHVSIGNNLGTEKNDALRTSDNDFDYYCLDWDVTWGGSEAEYGRGGIAIDDNGSIYITGSTYSFGSGGYDAYLIKYDEAGKQIWNLTWGDSQHQNPHDITISPSENIYITGEYRSIAGSPSYVFLVKFDSYGNYQWDNKWGPSTWNEGFGVAVDEYENIYVTGRTGNDFVLLKYNSNGNQIWNKINASLQGGKDVALGSPGTLYTVGGNDNQAYLSKYNDDGTMIWHRVWGGPGFEYAHDMTVDSSYNVYYTGRTSSFGAGLDDVYIVKYNSSGSLIWNTTWGTPFNENGYGIKLDENDNIYLTGEIEMSGIYNAFIAKFDSEGSSIWDETWGGYGGDYGNRIGLNTEGYIYVTGTTNSYGAGNGDAFILKYKPSPIKINLPQPNAVFGKLAPIFNVIMSIPNLDQMWYTLDNGLTNITFISNGTIDQGIWDTIPDGKVVLKFFANNTNGNLWSASVSIVKNTTPPIVNQEVEWYKTWGIPYYDDFAFDVTVDTFEDIYVTGVTHSDMGPGNITLRKYNSQGNLLWNREWGGSSHERGDGVTVNSNGNALVVGSTQSFSKGGRDICLVKFDNNGNLIWNVTWGDTLDECGSDLVLDSDGNIYISGWTSSYGAGSTDALILKFNSSGNFEWFKTWGSSGNEWGESIALDSNTGNLFIVGSMGSSDQWDVFVVCYNSSGNEQWHKIWDGNLMDGGRGINVDSFGNIYATGYTEIDDTGNEDILILKLDKDGNVQWTKTWGGNYSDRGQSLSIDSDNNLYVTGFFEKFRNQYDVCILAYNSDGDIAWNFTWGGDLTDYGFGIALGQNEDIYVSGFTESFNDTWGDAFIFKYFPNYQSKLIIINSPNQNTVFGKISPTFNIQMSIPELNEMWYTCDNGLTNITFTSNGSINQGIWDGLSDGNVILTFFANDINGAVWSELIPIIKDTTNPSININNPTLNGFFGTIAPQFNISIEELHLNTTWYTVDDGITNISFSGVIGIIDQSEWEKLTDGLVDIGFYANDSAGNIGFSEITVGKDTINPQITIISPKSGEEFSDLVPTYQINILESNLDSVWYTIDQGLNNFTIINYTGIINETVWFSLPNGYIYINFYAKDLAGNIDHKYVVVIKNVPQQKDTPISIPGYGLITIAMIGAIVIIINVQKKYWSLKN